MSPDPYYPDWIGPDKVDLDQAFEKISQALLEKRADFLFGAGMSKESKVPIGRELSKILIDYYFPKHGAGRPSDERIEQLLNDYSLEAIAEAVERKGKKRSDLTNLLKKVLLDPALSISDSHRAFQAVALWDGYLTLERVFTTNFDYLIERTFDKRAAPITRRNTRDIDALRRDHRMSVIHLHGTLEEDDGYILTEKDVYAEADTNLFGYFISALSNADAFVFVGYSLSDPDFKRIYHKWRESIEKRGENDKFTYVVSPTDEAAYMLGRRIWEARSTIWIPLDAKVFFQKLRSVMSGKKIENALDIIRVNTGINDSKVLSSFIDTISNVLGAPREVTIYYIVQSFDKQGPIK